MREARSPTVRWRNSVSATGHHELSLENFQLSGKIQDCAPFIAAPHRDEWAAQLLAHADPQRFHLAVEMAAFEAEQLGGVADVVAGFFNLLEDVFALVGVAGLLER